MFNTLKYAGHLYRISYVMAKHDVLRLIKGKRRPFLTALAAVMAPRKAKGRDGERLAAALQELGPTFIKLGQALSTRADMVGEDVARDLSSLQDAVPPFSFKKVKATIEEQLGKPLNELFQSFDEKPVAAASIAQVHFAVDYKGREVAVKVLRPDVEEVFARDISLMYGIANLVERFLPRYKRLKSREVVDQFARTVRTEMDLRLEASAATELAQNFANDETFKTPDIFWSLTAQRVLTMERVAGIRIDDHNALIAAGHDVDELMRKAAYISFNQVFRDGFFHADMHPGNIFVRHDGVMVAVDFGIMGRLDQQTRLYLARLLHAFLNRDYETIAEIHVILGYIPSDQDVGLFAQACRAIGEPIFDKKQSEISMARVLGQMLKMFDDFEMEAQPQLLLLQKTLVLAEGLGRGLNPDSNFWELSRPLMEQWVRENMGPIAQAKKLKEKAKMLPEMLHNLGIVTQRLPHVVTEKGVMLHPDTVRAMTKAYNKRHHASFWKIVFISATVSVLVVFGLDLL